MGANAQSFAKEARLCRQTGHTRESEKLLRLAQTHYPFDKELQREASKLKKSIEQQKSVTRKTPIKQCAWALTCLVDTLGLPLFFFVMAWVAWLLGPILLVPAS
jgi:hypothetical protein